MDNNIETLDNQEKTYLNIILDFFLQYWKLFVLSFVLCFASAFVYLRYASKAYQVNAKVLLKDDEKGAFNSQTDMLADFGFQAVNTNVENEIEVITSKSVVGLAVKRAGLYVKYLEKCFVVDRPIYKSASPVQAAMPDEALEALNSSINIAFELNEDSFYSVSYKYYDAEAREVVESLPIVLKEYPYVLSTKVGDILLTENASGSMLRDFTITIYNPDVMASVYQGSLAAAPVSKTASVVIVAVVDNVPQNGIDFINSLIVSYNIQANEDKNIVAQKTEEFINARIKIIGEDLRIQEKNLANYKKDNKLINPTGDVSRLLDSEKQYVERLREVDMQLQQIENLRNYLNDENNEMQAIAAFSGVSGETALASLITRYNVEVAKRKQLLASATEENPTVVAATQNIQDAKEDIVEVLENLHYSLQTRKDALESLTGEFMMRASQTPAIERVYADLTRERDIKSQLYVMLLQKYEENALALAVTADNLKCIEPAKCAAGYVSPNRKMTYLFALFLSLALPSLFIYVYETLGVRVKRLEDIEKIVKSPILGSVPLLSMLSRNDKRSLVVEDGKNDVMAEAFRSIRTNLQFLIQKNNGNVVMFTSTTSGEGKTFVSSNYAMSLAVMGKKVLYMGFDIRRPRLAEVFNLKPNLEGITSFIASDGSNLKMLDDFILPSGVNPNLFLLTAGIIPPNPAELIAKDTVDKAIAYLSQKFDYLVLDTAPVGLVSDSIILSRVADAVVYVTRVKYTHKADLKYLNKLVADDKLKNVAIVVNADDMDADGGRFGMRSKRYGYSYYGYGYTPELKRRK